MCDCPSWKNENLYKVIVASLPKHISFKLPRNGRNPLESVFSSLNFKQNCRKKPFYTVSNVSLKHRRRVSTIMCSVQFFFKENIPVEVNTLLWGDNSRAKPTSCSCSRKAQKYRLKMWWKKMTGRPGQTRPLTWTNMVLSWEKICRLIFFQIPFGIWWHWVSRYIVENIWFAWSKPSNHWIFEEGKSDYGQTHRHRQNFLL